MEGGKKWSEERVKDRKRKEGKMEKKEGNVGSEGREERKEERNFFLIQTMVCINVVWMMCI